MLMKERKKPENNKKIEKKKLVIVILSILIGVNICALATIIVYNRFHRSNSTSVIVPDNIISGDDNPDSTATPDTVNTTTPFISQDPITVTEQPRYADLLVLYKHQNADNTPFSVSNMFPGDSVTKYYCLRFTFRHTVTLCFRADIQRGNNELADAVGIRIVFPGTGHVLYDGLMKDMPESLTHAFTSSSVTTEDVFYEVSVYLDTSVGNECMDQEVVANFKWWIEEVENLEPSPQTGDDSKAGVWAIVLFTAFYLFIIYTLKSREEKKNEQQNG